MPSGRQRKLKLNRQTIRALTTQEMASVAGGAVIVVPVSLGCVPTGKACIPVSDRCPTGPVGCPGPTIQTTLGKAPI